MKYEIWNNEVEVFKKTPVSQTEMLTDRIMLYFFFLILLKVLAKHCYLLALLALLLWMKLQVPLGLTTAAHSYIFTWKFDTYVSLSVVSSLVYQYCHYGRFHS